MGATIPAGARVLVTAARRPRRAEIWAFCLADATVVVHRFRRLVDGRFQFQGDARPWPDEPVGSELLVGRVIAIETDGGRRRLGRWTRLRDRARLDLDAIRRRLVSTGR